MARNFLLWLHGLGDCGPINEPIRTFFTTPEFRNAVWYFPSAPSTPVTCNYGAVIDKRVVASTNPENVFVCRFSQGGALTLASVLLYPKTLGGGAVFSGWVPFNSSDKNTLEAKKTPIFWSHGMADRTVLFEDGKAGPDEAVHCNYPGIPTGLAREVESFLEDHDLCFACIVSCLCCCFRHPHSAALRPFCTLQSCQKYSTTAVSLNPLQNKEPKNLHFFPLQNTKTC